MHNTYKGNILLCWALYYHHVPLCRQRGKLRLGFQGVEVGHGVTSVF